MLFSNWLEPVVRRLGSHCSRVSGGRRKRRSLHQHYEMLRPVELLEDRSLLASTPVISLSATPPSSIDEGDSLTVAGTASHTGTEDIDVYIRWYDSGPSGSTSASSSGYSDYATIAPGGSFSFSQLYGDDGEYTVSLWASVTEYSFATGSISATSGSTSMSGSTSTSMPTSSTSTVTHVSSPLSYSLDVDNVAPTLNVTDPTGTSVSVLPYEYVNLSGSATDPGMSDALSLSIDWDDGTSALTEALGGSGSFGSGYSYSSSGLYNVSLTLTDDDGGSDNVLIAMNVLPDPAPAFSDVQWPSGALDEGTPFQVRGHIDDNQPDDLTLSIDWGDGAGPVQYPVAPGDDFTFNYTYFDDRPAAGPAAPYSITITATDNVGNAPSVSHSQDVANVAPELTIDPFPDKVDVHSTFSISGSISDPGFGDRQTVTIDWGDGSDVETISNLAASDSFTATHQYEVSSAGEFQVRKAFLDYDVTVTVTDDDADSDSETRALPDDPEVVALFQGLSQTTYDVVDTVGATIVVSQSFATTNNFGEPRWQYRFRYLPYMPADGTTEFDIVQVAKIKKKLPDGTWASFIPSPANTDRYEYFYDVQENGYFVDVVPSEGDADGWSPFWSDIVGGSAATTNADGHWDVGSFYDKPGPATNSATYDNGQYYEMKWTFEAMIMEKTDDPGTASQTTIGGVSWGFSVAPNGTLTNLGSSAINTVSDGFQGAYTRFYEVKHNYD